MNSKEILNYLSQLKKHNNKEWFDANKKEYDEHRKDWIGFVDGLIKGINAFDPDLGPLDPKSCIFRINRDVRFSKDKSPYKSNFGASINKGGKKGPRGGYYIHFEPGNCFIAGGLYSPDPVILAAIRQEVDYNLDEFERILHHKDFKKYFNGLDGEKLSRPPKGYEADNPAIEYLKHKHMLAYHQVEDSKTMERNYDQYVLKVFNAMHPFIGFLNRGVEG